MSQLHLSIEEISGKLTSLFAEAGLSEVDAEIISKNLILTEAGGIESHGIRMVLPHLKRVKEGKYNLTPSMKVLNSSPSFTVVDADNGVGMYTATKAMEIAIDEAEKYGMHTVFSRNANTFGAAFAYTKMASDKGLIGVAFSNSPAAMAPWGGKKPLIGTNPISIAIPGEQEGPILFDMASSKVAKSKIGIAQKLGEDIPEGWALDKDGNPTTDPNCALSGTVLPLAEHKGYGLALCLDVLSGVISGAAFADTVNKFYNSEQTQSGMNVGQTFIAIDPKQVLGSEFYQKMDTYIRKIHSEENVRYPGEGTVRNLKKSIRDGILIDTKFVRIFED